MRTLGCLGRRRRLRELTSISISEALSCGCGVRVQGFRVQGSGPFRVSAGASSIVRLK